MASSSEIIVAPIVDALEMKFQLFMQNPAYIRYGTEEEVGSKRLAELFNATQGEHISNNRMLPMLMTNYMLRFPGYGITKKSKRGGIFYQRFGLAIDLSPDTKVPPLKSQETKEQKKIQRRIGDIAIANQLKADILSKIRWTELEYRQIIDLKLLVVLGSRRSYQIEDMITATVNEIVKYTRQSLAELELVVRSAILVLEDYKKCRKADLRLSEPGYFPRYTDRLAASTRTLATAKTLEDGLNKYLNTTDKLPNLTLFGYLDIEYPDIQGIRVLIQWLKEHSEHQVRLEMKWVHGAVALDREMAANTDPSPDVLMHQDIIPVGQSIISLMRTDTAPAGEDIIPSDQH